MDRYSKGECPYCGSFISDYCSKCDEYFDPHEGTYFFAVLDLIESILNGGKLR